MSTPPGARGIRRAVSVLLVTAFALIAASAAASAATDATKQPKATAMYVQPIHEAQVVRGDDGMDHIEYDLLVISVFDAPVTLSSVTTLGPTGKELATVDGNTLAAATQELFSHQAIP